MSGAPRSPQIEVRAPGAFDGGGERRRGMRRGIASMPRCCFHSSPFASRTVTTSASPRCGCDDLPETASGADLRTYELFAASFPERARGLNRTGFFREVGERGLRRSPMDRALRGALLEPRDQPLRGRARRRREPCRPTRCSTGSPTGCGRRTGTCVVELLGSWTSARELLSTPVAGVGGDRRRRRASAPAPTTRSAGCSRWAFSGSSSERSPMSPTPSTADGVSAARPLPVRAQGARPMFLELHRTIAIDDGRRQPLRRGRCGQYRRHRAPARLPDPRRRRRPGPVVPTLDRARRSATPAPGSSPPLPLGFVFKAKSFLELEGVRVSATRPE